jgi:hypothetical protein
MLQLSGMWQCIVGHVVVDGMEECAKMWLHIPDDRNIQTLSLVASHKSVHSSDGSAYCTKHILTGRICVSGIVNWADLLEKRKSY